MTHGDTSVFARATQQTRDTFLRGGTASQRFLQRYRKYPYPVRMAGLFLLGFALGGVIETFACKTHMYESVMAKKDMRRHEFDEFVADFRENMERWQRQDMMQRRV
ncbi:hypothetical protein C3747_32g750c [Trypanosoma cruzi]|uniref:Uncharacterized protein n=2 Tax=Trypanosoma cruzi TaxID=5693 RepID=Q4DJB0_TRYCC|nr:hypothetical protein, conserved [Trypanosoma cruzi]EAN92611.1 hypothetical protein, conserved [Trypanosoma cruzi]PWV15070.1 hypothetical protein C3747_32g750c [Trypanosoma cruzi]RNC43170.1 hypothetical protein TcCL_NonESM07148 [Trypanosoma cruzi]|eukprot:XP_814462.1 hypothetical protein [Trypanosoma cruzi strain CL Brener]